MLRIITNEEEHAEVYFADHVSRDDEYSACYRQGDVDGACGVSACLPALICAE